MSCYCCCGRLTCAGNWSIDIPHIFLMSRRNKGEAQINGGTTVAVWTRQLDARIRSCVSLQRPKRDKPRSYRLETVLDESNLTFPRNAYCTCSNGLFGSRRSSKIRRWVHLTDCVKAVLIFIFLLSFTGSISFDLRELMPTIVNDTFIPNCLKNYGIRPVNALKNALDTHSECIFNQVTTALSADLTAVVGGYEYIVPMVCSK